MASMCVILWKCRFFHMNEKYTTTVFLTSFQCFSLYSSVLKCESTTIFVLSPDDYGVPTPYMYFVFSPGLVQPIHYRAGNNAKRDLSGFTMVCVQFPVLFGVLKYFPLVTSFC